MYHIPGITADAKTERDAFNKKSPKKVIDEIEVKVN